MNISKLRLSVKGWSIAILLLMVVAAPLTMILPVNAQQHSMPLEPLSLKIRSKILLANETKANTMLEAVALLRNSSGDLALNADFSLNNQTIKANYTAKGVILFASSGASINNAILRVVAEARGPPQNIVGTINVSLSIPDADLDVELPLALNLTVSDTNEALSVYTNKGSIVVSNSNASIRLSLEFSRTRRSNVIEYSRLLELRIEAKDQLSVMKTYMALAVVLASLGIDTGSQGFPSISYDPAKQVYYAVMKSSSKETRGIETGWLNKMTRQDLLNKTEMIEAKTLITIETYAVEDQDMIGLRINASGGAVLYGKFSEGVNLDPQGYNKISEASGDVKLQVKNTTIKLESTAEARLSATSPHTIQKLVPMLSQVFKQGMAPPIMFGEKSIILEVEAKEPFGIYFDGTKIGKALFTASNTSQLINTRIAFKDTILESDSDSTLRYIYMGGKGVAYADFFNDKASTLIVEGRANLVKVDMKLFGKNLTDKKIIVSTPTAYLSIDFAEKTLLKDSYVSIELPKNLPEQLPHGLRRASPIYEPNIQLATGTVRLGLGYDKSLEAEGAKMMVAHFVDGKWSLLEPTEIDKNRGIAIVTVSSLSPFVVVLTSQHTEQQTSTTTITTTTQQTSTIETTSSLPKTTTRPASTYSSSTAPSTSQYKTTTMTHTTSSNITAKPSSSSTPQPTTASSTTSILPFSSGSTAAAVSSTDGGTLGVTAIAAIIVVVLAAISIAYLRRR